MAAFQTLGATQTINTSTSSATCANLNTSAPGVYIANRSSSWLFIAPISAASGSASVPMSTTAPNICSVPPNSAVTWRHGGGNFGWAGILEPGAGTGYAHIVATDGQE